MMKNDKRPRSLPAMLTALTVALAAAGMGATAQAASVTDEDILKDAETTHQIVTNGLGTKGQRYSPLAKVNVDTVKDLVPVWAFSFGGEKQRGQQSQPLIHDGKMFVTASESTPESLFCAADVAAESGMMRLYISQTNAM